jgi:hypothetical protein
VSSQPDVIAVKRVAGGYDDIHPQLLAGGEPHSASTRSPSRKVDPLVAHLSELGWQLPTTQHECRGRYVVHPHQTISAHRQIV